MSCFHGPGHELNLCLSSSKGGESQPEGSSLHLGGDEL